MRVRTVARQQYEASFKEDCLAALRKGERPVRSLAADLGIPERTLYGWYNSDMAKKGKRGPSAKTTSGSGTDAAETVEQKIARLEREVAALRKKNEQLEMDRAILKKAAAFFAKESE